MSRLLSRVALQRAEARGAGNAGGFTLIELMVSMAAGLVVAMAVVNLSREATTTFHEETRIAATEMQLRTAIDRLRADVSRAAFMSTGNIFIDPGIHDPSLATVNVNQSVYSNGAAPVAYQSTTGDMSLYDLAGIRLFEGGGSVYTPLALSTVNFGTTQTATPDTIEIGGDMTGVEVLPIGTSGGTAIAATQATGCGQRIYLEVASSPALWRLVGMSPNADATYYATNLNNAFQPVSGASFIVRIVDNNDNGRAQYAATCKTGAAGWATATSGQPYVDLDPGSTVNLTSTIAPNATINPVQIVRWQIQTSSLNTDAGTGAKYDLVRQYLSAFGVAVGSPEVVAEYAVDLKFAFTVDTLGNTTGNYSSLSHSSLLVNSFEAAQNTVDNATIAGDVKDSLTSTSVPTNAYPQRIRSVRIRLATRAAVYDRTDALSAGAPYLYRYCVNTAGCTGNPPQQYARTRTLISEVAVPNQSRLWFQ